MHLLHEVIYPLLIHGLRTEIAEILLSPYDLDDKLIPGYFLLYPQVPGLDMS